MFSSASSDPSLSDKDTFTTLVRMGPPFRRLGPGIGELFAYFKWHQFVLISRRPVGSKHVFCDYASRSIEEHFRDSSVLAADWLRFTDGISDEDIDAILENTKQRGRSENNF